MRCGHFEHNLTLSLALSLIFPEAGHPKVRNQIKATCALHYCAACSKLPFHDSIVNRLKATPWGSNQLYAFGWFGSKISLQSCRMWADPEKASAKPKRHWSWPYQVGPEPGQLSVRGVADPSTYIYNIYICLCIYIYIIHMHVYIYIHIYI